MLNMLGVLNKVPLSPEISSGKNMMHVVDKMAERSFPVANMFFHSTTLAGGLSPFVTCRAEEDVFVRRIESLLAYASDAGLESMTLCRFENYLSRKSSMIQGGKASVIC